MDKELRILMVEDFATDAELNERELRKANIPFSSRRVETKEGFIKELENYAPDIILSDYSLPSFDGIAALKIVQERYPDIPFIFVTGVLGEETAIETLKMGATDYVLKGGLTRLVPAVGRALREAEQRTERRRAEEKILEQADLLNKAQDAIIVRDLEDCILFCNERTLSLYGLDGVVNEPGELIGKTFNELFHEQDSSQFEKAKRIVLERGKWVGELSRTTKDGREVIVESRMTLVRDDNGRPKSILCISTDVTERKRLEAQFLRAQRMESIGTLAGGIAHDLNNILQPIMMSLQILRMRITDEGNQHLLNTLETSTRRGADLVRQVLSFARGLEGEHTILQMGHIISEMVKILGETFPKLIEIHADIPKNLWIVSGDPTQLHQVLMNLCVNARDAISGSGKVAITAENMLIDENYARMNIEAKVGPYIVITVSDTGTGIPLGILDRVFEPFFTTKGPGKGTGLGLSTAFGIMKGHGGFIEVHSEVGRGARFKVYLPAIETTEVKRAEGKWGVLPRGNGELILVVDDEASIREITRATLEAYGYRVITASDGAEAIGLYTQKREELRVVLIDMVMPIMGGPATIRALYKINPRVTVIAMSGLKEKDELAEITGIDVSASLSKPHTAEVLLKTLHDVLKAEQDDYNVKAREKMDIVP